jgi:short-subunit dehydrogenase
MKKYEGYALITGGSDGMGLEFAKQLAEEGYNLVLVARETKKLKAASDHIKKKYKVDVVIISQDLTKIESADLIYDELKKNKIHVGLLVNNAGFAVFSQFDEMPRQKSRDMISLMCMGYVELTHKFLPDMLKNGSGGIIILSSVVAKFPGPFISVYSSTKAFSLQFGRSLHAEYHKKGIDVLTVCPGAMDTKFFNDTDNLAPSIALLKPENIVPKSLEALGKDIVITFPNDIAARAGLIFTRVMSDKLVEKVTLKIIKDMFHKK